MKTRQLGKTDLHLTEIGLGTWAIGGADWQFGWGPQDDRDSIRTIHEALDLGINWIDTAPAYGLGHSEEIVGRVIAERREKPLIATKCSLVWGKERTIQNVLKAGSIRREIEASLRRLKVDVIDLCQIHWPNPDADIEEAWTTLAELREEGKIRYPAVCNFSSAQIRRALAIHPVASLQPPYSMLQRGIEHEILPYCADHGIGVVVYSPMQRGLLTGAITPERMARMDASDYRTRSPMFREPELSLHLEFVTKLRNLAEELGRTPAQLAIAWTLRRGEVTAAIVGSRRPGQISETAPAAGWDPGAAVWHQIEEWLIVHDRVLAEVRDVAE
ncbi:MAG TPA: aldo/keto reductase [bacterium]|nr:aldo/keto reductase [bacterium]